MINTLFRSLFLGNFVRLAFFNTVLAALLVGSFGCSTRNVGVKYDFNELGEKSILFGSVSQTKSEIIGGSYGWLYYKGPKSGWFLTRKEKVPASYVFSSGDFSEVSGHVILVEVPPGEYVFHNWRVNNGSSATIIPKVKPEEIKFNLKEGEIHYIGNFHFEMIEGVNFFGANFVANTLITVKDELERDFEVAKQRYQMPEKDAIVVLTTGDRIWGPPEAGDLYLNPVPVPPSAIQ